MLLLKLTSMIKYKVIFFQRTIKRSVFFPCLDPLFQPFDIKLEILRQSLKLIFCFFAFDIQKLCFLISYLWSLLEMFQKIQFLWKGKHLLQFLTTWYTFGPDVCHLFWSHIFDFVCEVVQVLYLNVLTFGPPQSIVHFPYFWWFGHQTVIKRVIHFSFCLSQSTPIKFSQGFTGNVELESSLLFDVPEFNLELIQHFLIVLCCLIQKLVWTNVRTMLGVAFNDFVQLFSDWGSVLFENLQLWNKRLRLIVVGVLRKWRIFRENGPTDDLDWVALATDG